MSWLTWTLIIYYLLSGLALMPIFERAGRERWEAAVPVYNMVVASEIVGRKRSFGWWMLFPVVNFFTFSYLMIDLARSFGRDSFWEHFSATMLAPLYWTWLDRRKSKTPTPKWVKREATKDSKAAVATTAAPQFFGPVMGEERAYRQRMHEARKAGKKDQYKRLLKQDPFRPTMAREWISSIIFAVFAAGFIRMFLFEAYMIPSSSMEGNLMTGDYLIVSKLHYGLRLPETVLTMPLTHNTMPVAGGKSYIDKPQLPHRRLPRIENIDRYDEVVFNVPNGDSVYIIPGRTYSAGQYQRGELPPAHAAMVRSGQIPLVTRPRDKRDHYVKRCVGLPGDSLRIVDRRVYINGELMEDPEGLQYQYIVRFSRQPNTSRWTKWGISEEDVRQSDPNGTAMVLVLNQGQIDHLREQDPAIQVEHIQIEPDANNPGRLYPHFAPLSANWTIDNFGPIFIPSAGTTVRLTMNNYQLYRRAITVYEGHDLELRGRQFYLDGEAVSNYTFEQDYYWLMGDNRHNSEDSRVWGFVPQDHIVGKPLLILFSLYEGQLSKGIDWSRFFKWAG
ncbi:MAG: S26 family signal peptidase [Bacteroidota bacterium]